MCGISGIVSDQASTRIAHIRSMISAQQHRGPDDHGHIELTGCLLGHNRLSIVDLGGGHQPMRDSTGRYTIVFNGEIYGYKDIRKATPFDYKTDSDTEVILALFARYGVDCIGHIPGMFAFAIWDEERRSLFAARDRFGEKPLYFAKTSAGELLFASELKSILASGLIDPEIDPSSISFYLQKMYVHPHKTIYKNVHVLPPAHAMTFADGELHVYPYWKFPEPRKDIGLAEASEQFASLFSRSVKDQLIADVPVAAFLSGGLDSSTVVSEAVKFKPDITTISYRFAGGLDEGEFARAVANKFHTNHVELFDDKIEMADLLRRMAAVYDEPFGDSSNIPTYLICKSAREQCNVKVVLTGDGGDELLGGYVSRYRPLVIQSEYKQRSRIEAWAALLLFGALRKFTPGYHPLLSNYANGLKGRLKFDTIPETLNDICNFFTPRELAQYGIQDAGINESFVLENNVNDAMKADILRYMPGDILVKTDRAAMANGLELRAPFLDVALAEFLISLPSALKIDRHDDKILLRRTYEKDWPELIRNRGKQGFGAPISTWLKLPDVAELKRSVFSPGRPIYDLLPPELIAQYGQSDCDRTWGLLNLGVWLESSKGAVKVLN